MRPPSPCSLLCEFYSYRTLESGVVVNGECLLACAPPVSRVSHQSEDANVLCVPIHEGTGMVFGQGWAAWTPAMKQIDRYKKEPSRRHSGALYSLVRRQIEFRCHLFSLKKTVLCDKPQKQYYSFNLLLYSFNMLLDLITIFLKILVSPFMRVLGLWFLFLYYLCLVSVSRLYWPHKMSYFLHFFLLEEIV